MGRIFCLQNLGKEVDGALIFRMFEDVFGGALFKDFTAVDEDDAVGDLAGNAHLVRDDDHRHALGRQLLHDGEHLADHLGVERACRFVKQHDLRLHAERADNGDTLLLAAGQLGRIRARTVGKPDAAGTVVDTVILETLDESVANVAYELTFLAMGVVAAIYVLIIKRDRLQVRREGPKLLGAVCETAGQFAYIFAIGDEAHTGSAAAIISCYCALSVVWSRIFLKEKLSWKHYVSIAVAVCGIVTLGFFDA